YADAAGLRRLQIDRIDAGADLLNQAQLGGMREILCSNRPQDMPQNVHLRKQPIKKLVVAFLAAFDFKALCASCGQLPAPGARKTVVQKDLHLAHGKELRGGRAPQGRSGASWVWGLALSGRARLRCGTSFRGDPAPNASAMRSPSFHFAMRSDRANE